MIKKWMVACPVVCGRDVDYKILKKGGSKYAGKSILELTRRRER